MQPKIPFLARAVTLFGRRWTLKDLLIVAALVAACVIFLFPIAMVIMVSFKAPIDIMATPQRWLFAPTLDDYQALLGWRPSEFQFDLWLHFNEQPVGGQRLHGSVACPGGAGGLCVRPRALSWPARRRC